MFENALTSFSLGLLAVTSPCVFPLYPGFLAYLSGQSEALPGRFARYLLGFFVLAGVLTMMLLLGALFALLAVPVGQALAYIIPAADLILITLGVLLLFNVNVFKKLPTLQIPALRHPFANAFVYGLLYGPIALPCSGPLIVGAFALSLSAAETAGRLLTFLWFGLGFGMPLLVLSLVAGATQRNLTCWFAQHSRTVNLAGGLLLVGVGVYDLAVNWQSLRLIFG